MENEKRWTDSERPTADKKEKIKRKILSVFTLEKKY